MGLFSGGSTTTQSDSYSGLRGTGYFKPTAKSASQGYTFGMDTIRGRIGDTNPLGLTPSGLTAAQNEAFSTLGKQLFGNVSSNYAARGFLSPDNVAGVIGSSLQQAAPTLLDTVGRNQMGNQAIMSDRFGALNSLLGQAPGLLGSEQRSTSVTKGPNLLGQAVAGWANPAQLGSFFQGVGSLSGGGGGGK